jgi:hypothetical protein
MLPVQFPAIPNVVGGVGGNGDNATTPMILDDGTLKVG